MSSSETWLCGAVAEKEPLGAREHPIMTRNSTRLSLLVAATLFFWSTVPTPAPAQTVSFTSQGDSAVGPHPQWVAVGDFNRDGKQDLAVANAGSNTVSVLLGNGDGTFQAAMTFAAGANPHAVAVGDFNGDGKLDLAVASAGSSTVSVLLGNGDGTFQAPRAFPAGSGPNFLAVGDFNGDGVQDLATANFGSNTPADTTVSVLLGNGDGTFRPPQTFGVGRGPLWVAAGDFNGDGRLDLAVPNFGDTTVSVLLGNGDGTFQAARNFPAGGSGPASVAVGDFNGDGRQDLAVTLYGDGSGNTLAVLLGNGDGTFGAPLIFGVGPGPVSSAVADFNGDGIQDLAVANWDRNVGHTVSVLLGNGDGTFQAAQNFLAGQGVASVAVGDFDGDGRPDLAAGNYGGDTVSVLMNNAGPPPGFTLTVIKAGTGSGTVTSTPAGINCGTSCSASYPSGTIVTLTATPSTGSTFAGWSGSCTTTSTTCTVTMSGARSVTATFNVNVQRFTLTVNPAGTGSGTVTSNDGLISCPGTCSATYDSGTVVTLTASAASGSTFGGWSGSCTGPSTTCTVTMNGARSVTATFNVSVQRFTLTVSRQNILIGNGTVTSSPAGINCGSTCSATYNSDTVVTLTATPAFGSVFVGWGGACSGILVPSCTVTMTGDMSVTATFGL